MPTSIPTFDPHPLGHGFLLIIDTEDGVSADELGTYLIDTLSVKDGVKRVNLEYLGMAEEEGTLDPKSLN